MCDTLDTAPLADVPTPARGGVVTSSLLTAIVVDDNVDDRRLLATVLRSRGIAVTEAAHAGDALQIAQASLPDVIVSDVVLPGMGGFELVRTMLGDDALSSVPVVLCSSYFSAAEGRAAARDLGVVAVVPKPFDAMTMFAAIDRALGAPRVAGGRPGSEAALRVLNRKLVESLDRVEDLTVERRDLLARVVSSEAAERRRLAADVHDDAIQVMLAAALELESMERVVHDDVLLLRCTAVVAEIRGAAGRLRDVLAGLPSTVPEGVTLAEAVRALGARHPFETQVTDHLDFAPEEAVFLTLYRVAQEALTNVAKHAEATSVRVRLVASDGGVGLRVSDNGRGCSPSLLKGRSGHFGLLSMRERAEIAGGWCRVQSRIGVGTTVEAWVPCETG